MFKTVDFMDTPYISVELKHKMPQIIHFFHDFKIFSPRFDFKISGAFFPTLPPLPNRTRTMFFFIPFTLVPSVAGLATEPWRFVDVLYVSTL